MLKYQEKSEPISGDWVNWEDGKFVRVASLHGDGSFELFSKGVLTWEGSSQDNGGVWDSSHIERSILTVNNLIPTHMTKKGLCLTISEQNAGGDSAVNINKEFKIWEMKKYKLGESKAYRNKILYRVVAIRDFGDVKAGDVGGWIETERNLCHNGTAWVYNEAIVYGKAQIFRHARIAENAKVFGKAYIAGNAVVRGEAKVSGEAKMIGTAWIAGEGHHFMDRWND